MLSLAFVKRFNAKWRIAQIEGCYFVFFDQLKRICEARGLKVTTTVKAAGLSTGLIGNWKSGGKPNYDTLCRLADYLGVSVQELVGDEPREAKPQERNELTEYLDQLRERPEMRMLFSVAKNATKEEVESIARFIEDMNKNK